MTTLRTRFEQRTGILVGTYYAPSHWSRWSPLYIGPVGGWGPDCHGYWRKWAKASGVGVSTFGHSAYITVGHVRHSQEWDRAVFRLAVAVLALVITGITALI